MPKLGIQLSSVAPYLHKTEHLKKSLARIAEMGYQYVNLQGISPEISDNQIAVILRENGLKSVAIQEDYPFGFGKDPDRAIERAIICGSKYLVFALIPPEVDTAERLKVFSSKLGAIYEKVIAADLIFSYHPIGSDFRYMGKMRLYEQLISLMPLDVQLTFCVHGSFGNVAYAEVLKKYGDRIDLVHFKDSITLSDGGCQLMPLGEGEHNWKPILETCANAGAKYIFAEQETWDRDPFECAEVSYQYLRSLGLGNKT
jgi:Sugar phosphate isomerases/epimerases